MNDHRQQQRLVFVGGYAHADQPGIQAFHFDPAAGTLTPFGSSVGVENPSFVAAHPREPWLYAVSETQTADGVPGSVWAVRFDRHTGSIEPRVQQPSGGDWPCHLRLDATERWLLVANYGTGSVAVLPVLLDGTLGQMTDLIQHTGASVDPERQTGPHAHSTTFTPDNRFVIVADLGIDQLAMYRFDPAAGTLTPHRSIATQPGAGPRHLAFHPDGQQVYVANELANTVTRYSYDQAAGTLHERETLTTLPPDAPDNTAADIHINTAGDRLYVSNRGHNSIAVFGIGADGQLTPVAIRSCGGSYPRNFALAPGADWILVANQRSDEVVVLPLDRGWDAIGEPVARVHVPQPACIQFVVDQV